MKPIAYWAVPPLLCLLIHWWCFNSWFRADDFAWLGLVNTVHTPHDLLRALFAPQAQGTIRPWSERAFFMLGMTMFGLDSLPYRIVIFGTAFADLALVAAVGRRLSGRPAVGFWAAVFWTVNSTGTEPLGWTCVYNEVMCAFFLLVAFYCFLRFIETGRGSWYAWQWVVFLLGFGALELNVVYPALAAVYAALCARKHLWRALALAPASVVYFVVHSAVAPAPKAGEYAMHFGGPMLHSLQVFWGWTVGPTYMDSPLGLSKSALRVGVSLVTITLGVFLWRKIRERRYGAAFPLAWFLIVIAPVLPLSRHLTEYYPFVPSIGLCWLGAWAFVEAWSARIPWRVLAAALALLYIVMVVPQTLAAERWNYDLTERSRHLVESLAGAHQQHPGKGIMLFGVDAPLFWNAIRDHSYQLVGLQYLYLPPGSEKLAGTDPSWSGVEEFAMSGIALDRALAREQIEAYDVRGPRLRNITSLVPAMPFDRSLPRRVNPGDPLAADQLGPEWYPIDVDHRWMPKRATVKIGGPEHPGEHLYLHGYVTEEQLRAGPFSVTATVDGEALPPGTVASGEFELMLPLPDAVVGKPQIVVTIESGRTVKPAADPRELGIAFGEIAVR
jgi:hypothetical protein